MNEMSGEAGYLNMVPGNQVEISGQKTKMNITNIVTARNGNRPRIVSAVGSLNSALVK